MNYNFTWNPRKARQNLDKHKVNFERAVTIFRDPNTLSLFDDEHSSNEERWLSLGIDSTGFLLVVCHTFHQMDDNNVDIRIISARKATKIEINKYEVH